MSLRPQPVGPVPDETVRIARAAFPKGTLAITMRDTLGGLCDDLSFASLCATRGRSAETPWRLALVTVLQFAEALSDRQAADAVRARIDWKYALSLELTDPGFDASVLSEFRTRLVTGDAEAQLFEALLARCHNRGLLKTGSRQRTDSTHVLEGARPQPTGDGGRNGATRAERARSGGPGLAAPAARPGVGGPIRGARGGAGGGLPPAERPRRADGARRADRPRRHRAADRRLRTGCSDLAARNPSHRNAASGVGAALHADRRARSLAVRRRRTTSIHLHQFPVRP